MIGKVVSFTVLLLLLFVTPAYAHKPIFEGKNSTYGKPIIIPDHTVSYAVYGDLETKEDIDFVKFRASKGETFFIQMTLPITKSNEEFKPYIALIGKGIIQKDQIPFKAPEEYGVIVIPPSPPEYFFEKFTQTSYYLAQSIRGEIVEDGDYYIAVYSPDRGGKYSLAIGEKEEWGFIDFILFPYMYLRVKYFFNPFATILIFFGVILIIAGIIRFILKRRRW
jgi:hypothetical protein